MGLLIVLSLAGCGGGPPAVDYAADADAICARADARLDALAGPESEEDALLLLDEAAPILRARRDALSNLDPPEFTRPAHELGLRALTDQLTVIDDGTRRRTGGEPVAIVFADVRARLSDIEPRIQAWRRGAELRVCGGAPVLALAVRPAGELLPPGLPDRPPSSASDESPARSAFRRTFEATCSRELSGATCRCAADRIGAAFPDDARYFAFARDLEAGDPAAREQAERFIAECLEAG